MASPLEVECCTYMSLKRANQPRNMKNSPAGTPSKGLTPTQVSLLGPLFYRDAWIDFQSNFEPILNFWSTTTLDTSLLGEPTLPEIESALRQLDDIIMDKTSLYWQRRVAYHQLAKVLASVEQVLAKRRYTVQDDGRKSPSVTTALLDTYLGALAGRSSRNEVRLRIRWAKRQSKLCGGSLFLLFAYSEQAETKMYVCTIRKTCRRI